MSSTGEENVQNIVLLFQEKSVEFDFKIKYNVLKNK